MSIMAPQIEYNGRHLKGKPVERVVRKIKDLKDIFYNKQAVDEMDQQQTVYEVESYLPVPHGTTGGLFFGITFIHPGTVGDEFFMTKGHFHKMLDRAEFYWCIEGEGMLILMDKDRKTWAERMSPGTLHYINGYTAHRTANTGKGILSFGACWPADAGHDYDTISQYGFSKILVNQNGTPALTERSKNLVEQIQKTA
jgi:glucose-6-phosphate isomerase